MVSQRGDIGADADERGLRERDLPGVAERQVEADGGDGHHRPHAEDEDAVGLEAERRDEEKHAGEREQRAERRGCGGASYRALLDPAEQALRPAPG